MACNRGIFTLLNLLTACTGLKEFFFQRLVSLDLSVRHGGFVSRCYIRPSNLRLFYLHVLSIRSCTFCYTTDKQKCYFLSWDMVALLVMDAVYHSEKFKAGKEFKLRNLRHLHVIKPG
jgi:hypothetical protein